MLLCIVISALETFLMMCSRGHYSIDIFVGISFALYIHIIVNYWLNYIYKNVEFLSKLKKENIQELKKIGVDWDQYKVEEEKLID